MSTDRFAFGGNHLGARFNAHSFGARLEVGYRVGDAGSAVAPYVAIQALRFLTPSYAETDIDGGGFGLNYASHTANSIRSELGTRFDYVMRHSENAVLALRGKVAWAYDWVSDPTRVIAFQGLPGGGSFVVTGASPAQNSLLLSVGPELRFANGISLTGKFDGEFSGRSNSYAGTGTVRVRW
jgi:outer membrane autotransporter protein